MLGVHCPEWDPCWKSGSYLDPMNSKGSKREFVLPFSRVTFLIKQGKTVHWTEVDDKTDKQKKYVENQAYWKIIRKFAF